MIWCKGFDLYHLVFRLLDRNLQPFSLKRTGKKGKVLKLQSHSAARFLILIGEFFWVMVIENPPSVIRVQRSWVLGKSIQN